MTNPCLTPKVVARLASSNVSGSLWYIDEFGVESIQSLLADREFVGDDWFTYLVENKIPFVIRLRKDMHIETEDGKQFQ